MINQISRKVVLGIIVCIIAIGAASKQPSSAHKPTEVVKIFYKYHLSHDMGFTEASIKAKEQWFTIELLEMMLAKVKEPVPKYEDPDIDGDPFTDSQEYPQHFKIKGCSITGNTASVTVQVYPPERRRIIKVQMVNQAGLWQIDDMIYEDSGTLRKLLQLSGKA